MARISGVCSRSQIPMKLLCHYKVCRTRPSLMQIAHTPTPCQRANQNQCPNLCDHGAGSGALVSPGWWEDTDSLVVTGQTMDTGLDENETELGVLVLSVSLEVLADGNGLGTMISKQITGDVAESSTNLLDQHVQVLWNLWGEAYHKSLCQSKTKQRHNYVCYIEHIIGSNPMMAIGIMS